MIGSRVKVLAGPYFDDDPPAGAEGIVDDYYEHDGAMTAVVAFPNGQMAAYGTSDVGAVEPCSECGDSGQVDSCIAPPGMTATCPECEGRP